LEIKFCGWVDFRQSLLSRRNICCEFLDLKFSGDDAKMLARNIGQVGKSGIGLKGLAQGARVIGGKGNFGVKSNILGNDNKRYFCEMMAELQKLDKK
jgi:hypothetical protein